MPKLAFLTKTNDKGHFMVKQMNGLKFHSRHLSWTEDNEPLPSVVIDLLHVNNYMPP